MGRILLIAAALALSACATTSDTTQVVEAAPAVVTASAAELDPNEEVCRRVTQTGTRFNARVCKTRAEWEREAIEARDVTRDMQREVAPPECALTGRC